MYTCVKYSHKRLHLTHYQWNGMNVFNMKYNTIPTNVHWVFMEKEVTHGEI